MTDTKIDRLVKLEGTNYDRRRKLTVEDVAKIRRLYKKGWPISDLAYVFGVKQTTIKYHVDENFRKTSNKLRNAYKVIQHPKAQFDSRVAYKRKIIGEIV